MGISEPCDVCHLQRCICGPGLPSVASTAADLEREACMDIVREAVSRLVDEGARVEPLKDAMTRLEARRRPGWTMPGAERIGWERVRQIAKGRTPEHDDEHVGDELLIAAVYCIARAGKTPNRVRWPWANGEPSTSNDDVRLLEKAGALVAAEIDRRLRERRLGVHSTTCIGGDRGPCNCHVGKAEAPR